MSVQFKSTRGDKTLITASQAIVKGISGDEIGRASCRERVFITV